MAIVIVGGGAIGLLVSGRLALANQPVALLGRAWLAEALAQQPLLLREQAQTTVIPRFPVADSATALPVTFQQPDLAILTVKGYDTADAIMTLGALAPRRILTLQNGIGNEETLAATFGAAQVVAGAITSSVEPEGATKIIVTKSGGIGLAALDGPAPPPEVVTALHSAGFPVATCADYRALKWSKALLNMLGNATAAILDLPVAEIYADRRLVALERAAFLEALAVMRTMGVRPVNLPRYPAALLAGAMRLFPLPLLHPLLRQAVAGGRGGKDPSLLRDLRQGRQRSEGQFLYGAIAARAAELGVAAPVNTQLWQILDAIARGKRQWQTIRRQPAVLLAEVGMARA